VATDWENLIADLERATARLLAVDLGDTPAIQDALDTRARVIAVLQAELGRGALPPGLCARLESACAKGGAACLRLAIHRASLRAEWSERKREVRWLQQVGGDRQPPNSIDCTG